MPHRKLSRETHAPVVISPAQLVNSATTWRSSSRNLLNSAWKFKYSRVRWKPWLPSISRAISKDESLLVLLICPCRFLVSSVTCSAVNERTRGVSATFPAHKSEAKALMYRVVRPGIGIRGRFRSRICSIIDSRVAGMCSLRVRERTQRKWSRRSSGTARSEHRNCVGGGNCGRWLSGASPS